MLLLVVGRAYLCILLEPVEAPDVIVLLFCLDLSIVIWCEPIYGNKNCQRLWRKYAAHRIQRSRGGEVDIEGEWGGGGFQYASQQEFKEKTFRPRLSTDARD